MMHSLAGVYAAAVTPLKADFSPDLEAIPPLLDFFARRGCHGALLLGTTGEGPSFSPDERVKIFSAALEIRALHPAFRLLAGTGTPSLTETITLTRTAFDLGYDAVVVLPPYYFRTVTENGLFAYFSELIHQALPRDGSLLIYHIPSLTGVALSLFWLKRLKQAFPRQFVGLKDSSHQADFARQLGDSFGEELAVFTGTDSFLHLALESHSAGCITAPANLISPELRRVWDSYQAGEDAIHPQERVTAIRHILEKYPPFPPILKALLARQQGFPLWPVRPPLMEVGEEKTEKATAEMKAESF
jgi:4-hydroxy-tetrahydrodipicolinate synthase